MPAYHSENKAFSGSHSCGAALIPITKTRTVIGGNANKEHTPDIIDEAIALFRANIFFRNFKPESGADLTICYATVLISELLKVAAKEKKKEDAAKKFLPIGTSSSFSSPGDKGFPFPGFFSPPANSGESKAFTDYFRAFREELAGRLLDVIFNGDGTPNKHWMQFSKRKFMNIEHT